MTDVCRANAPGPFATEIEDRGSEMSLSECREQDVVRITTKDGETFSGSYLTQAGMHFISIKNPESILLNKVVGPYTDELLTSLDIIKSRDDVLSERYDRLRGERVRGFDPVTREDFEYRLSTLAKAAAQESGKRKDQILRQFDDVADQIKLARSKRQWVLSSGHWALKSNAEPTMSDLWHADIASPSLLKRPRPQDFDPDPKVRKAKTTYPHDVIADPSSVPNMLSRLKKAGFKAIISLAGEPVWDRAEIQVDLAEGRSMRFLLNGRRFTEGQTHWTLQWGGNDSKPGLAKKRQAKKLSTYKLLHQIAYRSKYACADCDVNTSDIGEYYMVRDDIWTITGLDYISTMLCIQCLENRIGRKLAPNDFTDAPINLPNFFGPKSDRLADRLGHRPD